jgi:hypothetical protein
VTRSSRPFARLGALAALWSLGVACADYKVSEDADTGLNASATDTAADSSGTDSGPPLPEVTWRGWDGRVVIAGGEWILDGKEPTSLAMGVWATDALVCVAHPGVVTATTADLPDASVIAWWTVTLDEEPDVDCPYEHPSTLSLGFGELQPALLPAAAEAGIDPSALFGWYLQEDEGDIWAIGVAGTDAQFAGEPAELTDGLPDGAYQLTGLYLLPP